jgi:hypothetical protein
MKIELVNVQNMQTGMHVKVLADSKEVGVLYLSNEELDAFLDLIRKGVTKSDTEFVNSLHTDDGLEDFEDQDD